jgi:hypothetical protein
MKKIFFLLIGASFFAACNNNPKPTIETTKEIVSDTSSQYNNSINTDTGKIVAAPLVAPLPQKAEIKKEKVTKKASTSAKAATSSPEPVTKTEPATSTSTETSTTTADNNSTTESTPVVTPQKKGMSNSAKDAIIGGGVGAVGGAIISKKKGKGAIIGGLLGAGAGYIIGKKKDKKDTAK